MKKRGKKEQELLDKAYNKLAINIYADHIKNNRKTYAICGCNHGAGASEIAVNVAKILAGAGWNTALVNTDFHKKVEHPDALGYEIEKGIADLVLGEDDLDSIITYTKVEKLDYIACGETPEKNIGEVLCSEKFTDVMNQITSKYDFVILDTYPILEGPDAKIVCSKVDGVMLVTAINETTKDALEKAKSLFNIMDVNVVGVVVTKAKRGDITRRKNERKDYA